MTSLKLLVWRLNEPSPLAHEVILPSLAILGVLVLVLEKRTGSELVGVCKGLANRITELGDENLVWIERANADGMGLLRMSVVRDMYRGVVGARGEEGYICLRPLCVLVSIF